MSDEQLFEAFATTGAAAPFTTLVERHIDFVYSVALRIVRRRDLARDVCQAVFLELAARAGRLDRDAPIAGWLHAVARRRAIDVVRQESRRRRREAVAAELAAVNTPDPRWEHVAPLLDDALNALPVPDRYAILLRYFRGQTLTEVGAWLGVSADAAQKRISRALDQLHAQLTRRGAAASSSVILSELLLAHAVVSAPAGLAGRVAASSLAGMAGAKAAALALGRKLALLAAATVTVGLIAFESVVLIRQQRESTALATRLEQANRANAGDRRALQALAHAPDSPPPAEVALDPADAAAVAAMRAWLQRADRLELAWQQHPELVVPEMALLDPKFRFTLARDLRFDDPEQLRDAFARARRIAENTLSSRIASALRAYVQANDHRLPSSLGELVPYFDPAIDPALLARYTVCRTGRDTALTGRQRTDIVETIAPVDGDRDGIWHIGVNGYGMDQAADVAVREARRALAASHPELPPSVEALRPFLKWPVSDSRVQQILSRVGGPR